MKKLCSLIIAGSLFVSMASPLYAEGTDPVTPTPSSRPGIAAMVTSLVSGVQKYPYFTAMILLGASLGIVLQTTYGAEAGKKALKKVLDLVGYKKDTKPAVVAKEAKE